MDKMKVLFCALLCFFILTGTVQAKVISGKLSAADPSTRKVSVQIQDPVTGQSSTSDIWINADASLGGLDSFELLQPGDMIWVEAEADSEGNLRGTSLTKS